MTIYTLIEHYLDADGEPHEVTQGTYASEELAGKARNKYWKDGERDNIEIYTSEIITEVED